MKYLWIFFILPSSRLLADTMESLPHGPKGLVSYGFSFSLWLLLAFFLIVFFVLFVFLWKKFRRKVIETKRVNQALEVRKFLKNLEPEEPFLKKQQEIFFYELGFKLRFYIELKMGLPATDLTFKELKEPLRELFSSFEISSGAILRFLEQSELIKFSQKLADLEQAKKNREDVLLFLDIIDKALQKKEESEKVEGKGALL